MQSCSAWSWAFAGLLVVASACESKPAAETAPADTKSASPAASSAAATASAAPEAPPVPSQVPSAVASANLTMKEATFDGLKVSAINCHTTSGGLFASAGIFGALAKQKDAIHKCLGGKDARVHFRAKGGKTDDVRVAGLDAKGARCLHDVVAGVKFPADASCVATLVAGSK